MKRRIQTPSGLIERKPKGRQCHEAAPAAELMGAFLFIGSPCFSYQIPLGLERTICGTFQQIQPEGR